MHTYSQGQTINLKNAHNRQENNQGHPLKELKLVQPVLSDLSLISLSSMAKGKWLTEQAVHTNMSAVQLQTTSRHDKKKSCYLHFSRSSKENYVQIAFSKDFQKELHKILRISISHKNQVQTLSCTKKTMKI